MNKATIAEFEGDAAALKVCRQEYEQDAEEFWQPMASDTQVNEGDEAPIDGEAAGESSARAPGKARKDPKRTKVWKWLAIAWHMMLSMLNVG